MERGTPKVRLRQYLGEHRRAVGAVIVVIVVLVMIVLVWFQPQKLFIEETVNEAAPEAVEPSDTETQPQAGSTKAKGSKVLAAGTFQSLEHQTTGRVEIIELPDGRRFLRFEDLETSNGPDLRVYLSEVPASDDWHAYGERFTDLGALKGNRGNQNYEIPSHLDLSRYESAVIWCRRFTVGFGVAGLS